MWRRTYRDVDGLRVEGVGETVLVRNGGSYYLHDLRIYADGRIDSGSGPLVDLDGLRAELLSGRVATAPAEGARGASPYAEWRFADVRSRVDADMFLGEVADRIDRLNHRPDSAQRCRAALDTYLADPTEENRLGLRERYEAVPRHRRRGSLGAGVDAALRTLTADVGSLLPALFEGQPGEPVTAESHARAVAGIRVNDQCQADVVAHNVDREVRTQVDGPASAPSHTVYAYHDPAKQTGLHNGDLIPVTVEGVTYPSVTHAYWALATGDPQGILAEPDPHAVGRLGQKTPIPPGWSARRLAVMAELLRAKVAQHPAVAATLLATGESPILYQEVYAGDFWTSAGANWTGRLLQLIRAELAD
ncbi:putative NAD-dependent protein-ADP-ribosyltransferase YbiA (DUF1768 family) [Actinoplanes octamycinicus]|uniref:Putative NAD-dependent protein-ADP-ribosyltransferase YbiA (DUF1768 family) n=1 Tax=Actinoplanes octamycinicus TaxID=135948 RepID=A0A7W7GZY1_9ACTN|nr:NADAR family protein [Actinoplanes octamycinicus]MBB4741399.1 putative NAD-dependent protein-ADP-ribosyltransferase YbiA (DUF1768 family) [Actinoplanes octamycinicus]GIE62803.1 hypothetical protein Aoc01nite_82050 [Actinoplanes octamycinicus]